MTDKYDGNGAMGCILWDADHSLLSLPDGFSIGGLSQRISRRWEEVSFVLMTGRIS